VRGHFKQSISAFRLAGVTSLLAALVQWPAIVGNLETFNYNDLWWWSDYEKCVDFHTGLPFLTPDHYQSTQYCNDSRWGTAGALMTFLAMHCNILACAAVYVNNQVCVCIKLLFLFFFFFSLFLETNKREETICGCLNIIYICVSYLSNYPTYNLCFFASLHQDS